MVAWWRGDWTKKWQDIIRGSGIGTCPIKFPGLPAWSPVVTLSTLPSILTTLSLTQTKIVHSVNGAYCANVHRGCLLIVFLSQKWPSVCHWAPELVGWWMSDDRSGLWQPPTSWLLSNGPHPTVTIRTVHCSLGSGKSGSHFGQVDLGVICLYQADASDHKIAHPDLDVIYWIRDEEYLQQKNNWVNMQCTISIGGTIRWGRSRHHLP